MRTRVSPVFGTRTPSTVSIAYFVISAGSSESEFHFVKVLSRNTQGCDVRHMRVVAHRDGRIVKVTETAPGASRLPANAIPVNIETVVLLAADSFTQRS